MRGQQHYSYPAPSHHSRAMVILTLAIVGVVLCGMISQIAPRPQPKVLPIVHQQLPVDITHIETSVAG